LHVAEYGGLELRRGWGGTRDVGHEGWGGAALQNGRGKMECAAIILILKYNHACESLHTCHVRYGLNNKMKISPFADPLTTHCKPILELSPRAHKHEKLLCQLKMEMN
jgi:hypothetical protein